MSYAASNACAWSQCTICILYTLKKNGFVIWNKRGLLQITNSYMTAKSCTSYNKYMYSAFKKVNMHHLKIMLDRCSNCNYYDNLYVYVIASPMLTIYIVQVANTPLTHYYMYTSEKTWTRKQTIKLPWFYSC